MPRRRRRQWLDADDKCRCYDSWITRCCPPRFVRRRQDAVSEPLFAEATQGINAILDELEAANQVPAERHLGVIIIENADTGVDELALTWIYTDLDLVVPDPFLGE